jgi:hypothetical protein
MSGPVSKAKNTHYAASTFAAAVYALISLLASPAYAGIQVEAIPEIVVTAQRELSPSNVPEIVVWGQRDTRSQTAMEEIVVYGRREANGDSRVGAATDMSAWRRSVQSSIAWVTKARHWLHTALL